MIFRETSQDGDFVWGRGKQNYLVGNAAIAKNIETRLKTYFSEAFFDTTKGIPWLSLLGQKDLSPLLLAVRNSIVDAYGVVRVTDVSFTIDTARNITITYFIDSIYTTGIAGTVTL